MYVELPPEDGDYGKGLCGKLLVHLYGTRRAADGWHNECSDTLENMGFTRGQSSACVFWHKERHLMSSVHGDDFTTSGPKKSLDWFKQKLEEQYELKEAARLGPAKSDDREGRVLNRIVRWTDEGISYEADPRQAEKLIDELGLTTVEGTPEVKPSSIPSVKSPLPR